MSTHQHHPSWNTLFIVSILTFSALGASCKMKPEYVLAGTALVPLFNPHVANFSCQIEANKVPPIDAQADDWFLEARSLEDPSIFREKRDYKKIVDLTRRAAERHHWKAMLNLANLYLDGHDKPNGTDAALKIIDEAINLGIPAAYDRLGTHILNGQLPGDVAGAYAVLQKAAEMGSPQSMSFLGEKMDAGADGLVSGYWGNIPVATKMMECALAQGYGPAAEELHTMYRVPRRPDGSIIGHPTAETHDRVLHLLHEGVRLGCNGCAALLMIEFMTPPDPSDTFVPFIDKARSERYSVLAEALEFNPYRRFPNLDKILPLPPAPLPPWDGKRDSLLRAAMAVVPPPAPAKPTEASKRKGRYFLDAAYDLMLTNETTREANAPFESYWQPVADSETATMREFLAAIPPGLYSKGERFEVPQRFDETLRTWISPKGLAWKRVLTVRNNGGAAEPRTAMNLSTTLARPEPYVDCLGSKPCKQTGVWQPWVPPGHALEQAINQPWRQAWLTAGQPFPDPKRDWMLPIDSSELQWHLMEAAPAGTVQTKSK
ncbi:tetratricopeptide repeat protein [Massilia sp. TS11]|uniref:tetratricopeptide repeat protein n=1 Tax=Massilia sp. TS11 TaxID=2908003 RepID=UPI001EDBD6B1|nr:tetratricopeptide repeat protein [Massilia sp. TS11]MCG2583664.1 sel1 repeat family protein [Massilia sp. TS11]